MVGGSVITVLSNDEAKAVGIAERLGKRGEEGVYYRRLEGGVRTVLVPRRGDLLKAAECLTLSTYYYLYVGEIDAEAAELALLAKASGLGGRAATDDEAAFRRYFGELGLELGELADVDRRPDDLRYICREGVQRARRRAGRDRLRLYRRQNTRQAGRSAQRGRGRRQEHTNTR